MRISLFGSLRIEVAGQPITSVNTNRLQSLLAYLVLHQDTPQPREKLAFTLWPASREGQARTNLRQLLHSLKRALPAGCDWLVIDHFAIHWRQHRSCSVDVAEFEQALKDAITARAENDPAREMQCLRTAAQLYEDDLLPGLYDDWISPLRDEFRKKVCAALERLATMLEEQSEYAAAIPYAEPLVATEGYSAAEVGQTYERALELSRQLDNRNIFAIFSGVWVFHTVRGDLEKARQTSLEFLKEAEREPTPGLMLTGNFLLGSNLFHLGELEKSLAHLNAAMREHKGTLEPVLALFAGPDIEFFCRSYLCHIAWHRGDGNCGRDHVENAIAGARALRRPFSEAIALNYAAMLHAFEDETRAALERGREAVELCRRHGFTYYLAIANVLTGWAAAAQGEVEIGLAQLREGLDSLRRLGAELRLPYYFALLAETLARTGLAGEARASLSNGFAFASKNGEQWTLAELYRVQGNLLAAEEKMEAASASFQKGLEAARQCGSLAFEKKLSILVAGTRENYFPERF